MMVERPKGLPRGRHRPEISALVMAGGRAASNDLDRKNGIALEACYIDLHMTIIPSLAADLNAGLQRIGSQQALEHLGWQLWAAGSKEALQLG
jgi:hypothetical protein